MDDPLFQQNYQKYKLKVKLWEKDFKEKYGRIPSKYDIREASKEIRESYKMYYKLKTSLLENTLNDVLSEDGFSVLEATHTDSCDISFDESVCENAAGVPKLPLDISAIAMAAGSNGMDKFSNLSDTDNSTKITLNDQDTVAEFEPVEHFALNEKAWGSSVSKQPVIQNERSDKCEKKPLNLSLAKKLFQGTSFSKRNPRKKLSRSASGASLSESRNNLATGKLEMPREVLPDFETILLQKASEQSALKEPLLFVDKSKDAIKTRVDEGWLSRNTAMNGKMESTNDSSKSKGEMSSKKPTYGLSNITVTAVIQPAPRPNEDSKAKGTETDGLIKRQPAEQIRNESTSSDSDAVVANSEDECETQTYRHIVKRRRILNKSNEIKADSSMETQIPTNLNSNGARGQPSSTDEINSENRTAQYSVEERDFSADDDKDKDYVLETEKPKRKKVTVKRVQKKSSTNRSPSNSKTEKKQKVKKSDVKQPKSQTKKRKNKLEPEKGTTEEESNPLNPADLKYMLALDNSDLVAVPRIDVNDFESVDNVAQRYINTLPVVNATQPVKSVINEKNEVARKKLQDKISSGKLNENFVTINIQKKTFVRGKKTINYSKHKKKLWKHKKRLNALTGPNMDMGGCDGGVLTCFTCGQVGHFAQNCKIKGDTLLPLTAELEEDPSPFPTLEEAERMAMQSAVAVHSRNISQLPAAANAKIYRNENNEDKDEVLKSDGEQDTKAPESDRDTQESGCSVEELVIETDDELEAMDFTTAEDEAKNSSPIKKYIGHKIPEDFLRQAGLAAHDSPAETQRFGGVKPLYDLNSDGTVKDVTPEVLETLRMFGHTDFRKGQDRAVMRILSGLSTLVTLSTGSGKSLCYQLPAYMYSRQKNSITLVISPLVSLMEDQVTGVPHFLRAHCLHTNQTPQQRLKTLQLISDGEVDILLVSPEAVVAGERSTGFGSILRQLPPIAFACIDEVHCVSQWSHNFRPSYLMICKVLKKNLGVKTVLGLTATATLPTRLSIISHLGIHDGERGIISDVPLPDNLILSISKDENREAALIQLLSSERFKVCHSIIIYCTRRDECERIAGFIRTCLQENKADDAEGGKKKRKRINWNAEPYHAGMPSSRRRTIQNAFMTNELRIVVATIAFGMGINKPDIRSVIHYNMPRNFESYVQEIGRAGRDGKPAHCHLFLDARGGDQNELRRHIYANSIDRHVIRKLLQRVFVPCSCDKNLKNDNFSGYQQKAVDDEVDVQKLSVDASDFSTSSAPVRRHICPGHEIGFSIEQTVEMLDIPEENISTLLCYMELDTRWNISVLSSAYIMAKVISYGGPKYLKHAAKECPPLAMAIALEIKNKSFKEDSSIIEFSVVDIAAAIGWNSGVVKYQLKNLEWVQVNGFPKRSPISVRFHDLGFRIKAPGDFTAEEIDDALDTLYQRSVKQERTQLMQLQYTFQGLSAVAFNTYAPCTKENFSHDRSDQLKAIIRDYFCNDYPKELKLEVEDSDVSDDHIVSDVHAMLNLYPENNFSGRNLARIFHGISSPNYPAVMWGRCKYWRAHSKADFNRIVRLANAVIVKSRT